MTIKELEQKTGMARANIRFYEGEGLLTPKRLDNGYRDYSEEDVRTLEKIKLLRQLQLDIDTIRKLQQGALTLEQALFVQTNKLEGDRALIERAAAVCRELERSGVEYAALDPRPWLGKLQLELAQGAQELPPAPPGEEEPEEEVHWACWHPWMRWLARGLDISLYDILINLMWLLLFRDQSFIRLQTANAFTVTLWSIAMLALTLAVEPLWLHYWGWTPGKWLFGLKLRDKNGNRLSIAQARERSWRLARDGYGWNIPIWSMWKMWQGRKLGLEGQDCWWDGEEDYRYTKEERRFAGRLYVLARVALGAALFTAMLWSYLPPCRGPLDLPEFSRNYNHCVRVLEYGGTEIPTLDGGGRWKEQEEPVGTVSIDVFGDTTVYDQPKFTLDGYVKAVTLHMESQDTLVSSGWRELPVLLSLCRSTGELNLSNILSAQQEGARLLSRWEDLDQDFLGVHISQQVDYTGYTYSTGSQFLWPEDGDVPRRCEKTVTFSIPDPKGHFAPPPGQAQADGS